MAIVMYDGEKEGSKLQGLGFATLDNGDTFAGQWINSAKTGLGEYVWMNGSRYSGEFQDNKRQGHGKFIFKNGNVYVGEWSNGTKHGLGVFTYATGSTYSGQFADGNFHGLGVFNNSDGSRYEGEWKNDKQHGRGLFFGAGSDQEAYPVPGQDPPTPVTEPIASIWENGKNTGVPCEPIVVARIIAEQARAMTVTVTRTAAKAKKLADDIREVNIRNKESNEVRFENIGFSAELDAYEDAVEKYLLKQKLNAKEREAIIELRKKYHVDEIAHVQVLSLYGWTNRDFETGTRSTKGKKPLPRDRSLRSSKLEAQMLQ